MKSGKMLNNILTGKEILNENLSQQPIGQSSDKLYEFIKSFQSCIMQFKF